MNSKQFTSIAVITFVVGMIWLGADIIFNTKASIEISPKLESLLEPVNPGFNSRVLDVINNEVSEAGPPATNNPLPSPLIENQASESAEVDL